MRSLLTAVPQTLRNLARTPSFTISAVLTLGLGMAATTIIYSTFHSLVLRPLPFVHADAIHMVWQQRDNGAIATGPTSGLARAALENSSAMAAIAVYTDTEHSLTGQGEPVMLEGAAITAGIFDLLGVPPIIGRVFTNDEVREGAQVVVLSEAVWRTRFGGSNAILGTALQLGPEVRTVIGVMPSRFVRYAAFGRPHGYWIPLDLSSARYGLSMLVRTREDVDAQTVALALDAMAAALPPREGRHGDDWQHELRPLGELAGNSINAKRTVPRLFAGAALLLLIGCANVAGLLLVRLHARRRELAVRAALGARRRHLLGEMVAEQFAIATAAGGVGVLFTVWGIDLIRAVRPERLASLDNLAVSVPVLGFAALLVILTTLLFGALPALAVARSDLAGPLHSAGTRLTGGTRTRSVLVTLQLALSTLLLVSGFLLVRTVQRLASTDLGFNVERLLVASVPLPAHRYDAAGAETLMTDLAAAVRESPGIESVSISGSAPPHMGIVFAPGFEADGSEASTDDLRYIKGGGVSSGFFATLGGRVVEGREYQAGDAEGRVAVVNRAFAERFWPGESALGRRFRLAPSHEWRTVVGVVENMLTDGPIHADVDPMIFWPMEYGMPSATLTLRTAGDPMAAVPALRQHLGRLDPDLPLREVSTMAERMAGTMAAQRFNMIMLGLFAAAAALLCAIGLYGLVSYSLEQRVREVGVRIALGATPRLIHRLFMSQAVRLAAIGVPLGLAGALASARVMAALVHDVGPRDPLAYTMALIVIVFVVLPAAWIPARRAARTEPVEALRRE